LAKDLIPMLKNAAKKSANISFLFFNSLSNSKDETVGSLADFCTEHNLLVLKVKNNNVKVKDEENNMSEKKKFELIPFCSGLPCPNESISMICIVFELSEISSE
jgi:hypothetical protein